MAVTDLTNTKWLINNSLDPASLGQYSLTFQSNLQSFTTIRGKLATYIQYDTTSVYDGGMGSGWIDEAYRTIEITGGTDVTNANLIAWLQANAIQQVVKKYISSIKQNSEKYLVKDTEARSNITTLIEEQLHINVGEDDTLVVTVGEQQISYSVTITFHGGENTSYWQSTTIYDNYTGEALNPQASGNILGTINSAEGSAIVTTTTGKICVNCVSTGGFVQGWENHYETGNIQSYGSTSAPWNMVSAFDVSGNGTIDWYDINWAD